MKLSQSLTVTSDMSKIIKRQIYVIMLSNVGKKNKSKSSETSISVILMLRYGFTPEDESSC